MTRRIERKLKLGAGRQRASSARSYAMETLNGFPDRFPSGRGPDLDIAFLGTVALQHAGLPLDEIFATRASLLDHCGGAYFASSVGTETPVSPHPGRSGRDRRGTSRAIPALNLPRRSPRRTLAERRLLRKQPRPPASFACLSLWDKPHAWLLQQDLLHTLIRFIVNFLSGEIMFRRYGRSWWLRDRCLRARVTVRVTIWSAASGPCRLFLHRWLQRRPVRPEEIRRRQKLPRSIQPITRNGARCCAGS